MPAPRTEPFPRQHFSYTTPHFRTESHPCMGDGYVEVLFVKTPIV